MKSAKTQEPHSRRSELPHEISVLLGEIVEDWKNFRSSMAQAVAEFRADMRALNDESRKGGQH